ncbi:hypothetical protein EBT25_10545, partial [bacterium]|nr:hypothetical protein [bacterium]
MLQRFKFQYFCEGRSDGSSHSITVKTEDSDLVSVVDTFRQFLIAAGFDPASVKSAFEVTRVVSE